MIVRGMQIRVLRRQLVRVTGASRGGAVTMVVPYRNSRKNRPPAWHYRWPLVGDGRCLVVTNESPEKYFASRWRTANKSMLASNKSISYIICMYAFLW